MPVKFTSNNNQKELSKIVNQQHNQFLQKHNVMATRMKKNLRVAYLSYSCIIQIGFKKKLLFITLNIIPCLQCNALSRIENKTI